MQVFGAYPTKAAAEVAARSLTNNNGGNLFQSFEIHPSAIGFTTTSDAAIDPDTGISMTLGSVGSFKAKNVSASPDQYTTLRITPASGQGLTPAQIKGIVGSIGLQSSANIDFREKEVSDTHYAVPVKNVTTLQMDVSHPAAAGKKLKVELVGPAQTSPIQAITSATGGTVLDSFIMNVNPASATRTAELRFGSAGTTIDSPIPNGARIRRTSTQTENIYDSSLGHSRLTNVAGAYTMKFARLDDSKTNAHALRIRLVGTGGVNTATRNKFFSISGNAADQIRFLAESGTGRDPTAKSSEFVTFHFGGDETFSLVFPSAARTKTFVVELIGPYAARANIHTSKAGAGSGTILQSFFIDFTEILGALSITKTDSSPIPAIGLDVIAGARSGQAGTPAQMTIVNTVAANKYIVRLTQKTGTSISSRGAQANDIWNNITFGGGQPTHRGGNYAIYERTGATGTKALAVSNFFKTLIGSASFNFELIGPYLSTETTPRDATSGESKRVAMFDVFVDWTSATQFKKADDSAIGRTGGSVEVSAPATPFVLKYSQDSSNYLARITVTGETDADGRIGGFGAAQRTAAYKAIGITCTGATCPAKVATTTHLAQRLASGVTSVSLNFSDPSTQTAEYFVELIRGTPIPPPPQVEM